MRKAANPLQHVYSEKTAPTQALDYEECREWQPTERLVSRAGNTMESTTVTSVELVKLATRPQYS